MPTQVLSEYRITSRKKGYFNALYFAITILSFQWSVVLYINSSFLEGLLNADAVSTLYVVSSVITIFVFLMMPRILTKHGNYRMALIFGVLECIALLGMAFSPSLLLSIISFILHAIVMPLALFTTDIFMEDLVGVEEETTGNRRGLLLSIMSLTGALAALFSGFLIGSGTPRFSLAYTIATLILIPYLIIIMRSFKTFKDPAYDDPKLLNAFSNFWHLPDIRNVFFAHFLLQIFFAAMVIYSPLYLATIIGFNWIEIGQILFIGLLAYVVLEYWIGVIADRYLGEKEMMGFGFVIMAIATSWFTFLGHTTITLWMFAMFMTRVGASFVETTTEVYFFKHLDGKNADLVSFFRLTRPLSYVVTALLGTMVLSLMPFKFFFLILGFLMIPGLFFTMKLKDTR